jgi:hypothetical protein
MFDGIYEAVVEFASQGRLADELRLAKTQFVKRTGDLFESDATFERRLAAFLEWYTLDRPVSYAPYRTPARMYLEDQAKKKPEHTDTGVLTALIGSTLSLYEFQKVRGDSMLMVDLLSGEKVEVFERRKPAGLQSKDIIEARVVALPDRNVFSEAYTFVPREARRTVLKAAKAFRKQTDISHDLRVVLVHRVIYLMNRCARYKHVDPKVIFADLLK